MREDFVRDRVGRLTEPAPAKKKGRAGISPRPAQIVGSYLCRPTLLGAGAGFGLLAQAPRLRAAVATATAARIFTNFTMIFPSFPGMLPDANCGTSARRHNKKVRKFSRSCSSPNGLRVMVWRRLCQPPIGFLQTLGTRVSTTSPAARSREFVICLADYTSPLIGAGRRTAHPRGILSAMLPYLPTARRSASFEGSPAARIAFCAAAISYWSRRRTTRLCVVS